MGRGALGVVKKPRVIRAHHSRTSIDIRRDLLKELSAIESNSKTVHSPQTSVQSPQSTDVSYRTADCGLRTFSTLRAHQKHRDEGLHAAGFSEHTGIPDQAVAEAFDASLPRPWKGIGALVSIKAHPDDEMQDASIARQGNGAHLCIHTFHGDGDRIMRNTLRACAHANCWHRSATIDADARNALHGLILQRSSSSDRTPFPSVESIHQTNHLDRATQYWTELLALALSIDAEDQNDWEHSFAHALCAYRCAEGRLDTESGISEDVKTARDAFKLIDSNFVPWQAAHEREMILHQASREVLTSRAEELLDLLPEDIRLAFTQSVARMADGLRLTAYGEEKEYGMHVKKFPSDIAYALHSAERVHGALNVLGQTRGGLVNIQNHPALLDIETACEEIARACAGYDDEMHDRFAEAISQ